eukprot:TRINITY_DN33_c0_g1_i1.p1 TRINITY_DN33_c0_g1~~TRINITY_DN33_c0_g1_i1.p1  ORF type:complete len:484 (-),score=163.93 TRINITY_DN33_c0_g1_i1:9-1460(-)
MRSIIFALIGLVAFIAAQSDVLTLTTENFDQALSDNSLVLVEFYAPWCGHCKKLAPEYEKAATTLRESGVTAKLAQVDADNEINAALRDKFDIRGFPTLKLFRNGVPSEYEGGRSADEIVTYIRRQAAPAITELTNADEATKFANAERVVMVGFFNDRSSAEYAKFKENAEQLRNSFSFGEVIGNADVAKALGVEKTPSLILFKQFDEGKHVIDSFEDISGFLKANSVPLIDEIGPHNFKVYLDSGLPLAYLFVDLSVEGQKEENLQHIQDLARETKGKLNWVYIDWAKYAKHAERLGLSGKTVPAIAIEKMEEGSHYVFDEAKKIAKDHVGPWIQSFLGGSLKPTIKSEDIPEKNDEPVKIVVAHTFDQIVNDKTKDVLVEFYAPWCGHCKKLAPVYDELATNFASDPNVVIAKIDATANDVSPRLGIRGFPTIKLFKANEKDTPVDYEGDRSLEDMTTFLRAQSSFGGAAPAATGEKRVEL